MNGLETLGLLIILIFTAAVMSAQKNHPTKEPNAPVAITLERTPCFGKCPVYTVAVHEDGTIVYNGERFVEVIGKRISKIDPEVVAQMVQVFEDAGYFEWDKAYDTMTITDGAYVNTLVSRNDETHSIHRYTSDNSAPLALLFLEYWIDIMARTASWTGVPFDISTVWNGKDTPVATLEQTPCNGLCPVYAVALYADGTVVYMGIASVQHFGVHLFETEPASIASIPVLAKTIGYFNMGDSYDQVMMTDQSSFITSVRTTDQFKRITRYSGDPSAPIDLLWLEEAINELANSLMQ